MSERQGWVRRTIKENAYLRGRIGWQGLRADEFCLEGPYLVTGTDFDRGRVNWANCYHVSEARFREAVPIQLRDGDLLVTKDGTIGKIAHVQDCPEQAVLNSGVFLLRCADASFQHRFLYHVLTSHHFDEFLRQNLAGSTINHLYQYVFEKFAFVVPDDAHQERICRILDLIGAQLDATEVLIAKQERVRAGLMQELFTRGVDEHGRLRPPRNEAPHLYHQTKVGWLPKGWDTGSILRYCTEYRQPILTGPFGADLGSADFVDQGVPLLRIGNVQDRHLRLDDLLFVSERKARQLSKYRITPNDLLFARQGATTGRNALASQKVDGALINYHLIRVSLDPTRCNPRFVESMFNSWLITHQIEQSKGRGTREGINTKQISSLHFPGPEIAEQNRITTTLSEAMAGIEAMKDEITKLALQKAGLMQDLLTGGVSVAPLLESAAA